MRIVWGLLVAFAAIVAVLALIDLVWHDSER